jgi:hypothetical protein
VNERDPHGPDPEPEPDLDDTPFTAPDIDEISEADEEPERRSDDD